MSKDNSLITDVVKKIFESPTDSNIYLVEKLSYNSGFFVSNQKILYIVASDDKSGCQNIATAFLDLNTNVHIESINDFQQFKSGSYHILKFNYDVENENFATFIKLCTAHSKYMNSSNFVEFFRSLLNIFQIKNDQAFKNIIGFFGELSVINFVFKKYKYDLSFFWHKDGSNSKYDFSLNSFNLEIKSSIKKDSAIEIKHDQIFNKDDNILCFANLEKSPQGQSLHELITELEHTQGVCENLNYFINLEKELKRINPIDYDNEKFLVRTISFYDAKKINPFNFIPYNISNITYSLDVDEYDKIDFGNTLKNVKNI